jgi:hypothetical protein
VTARRPARVRENTCLNASYPGTWRLCTIPEKRGAPRAQVISHEIGAALLAARLVIGAIAGYQRHYHNTEAANCAKAGTILVTILADPKISYTAPQPRQ